jgi:hypothetical protein
VLASDVAPQKVVETNQVKIAAERERNKIPVKKYNGNTGPS